MHGSPRTEVLLGNSVVYGSSLPQRFWDIRGVQKSLYGNLVNIGLPAWPSIGRKILKGRANPHAVSRNKKACDFQKASRNWEDMQAPIRSREHVFGSTREGKVSTHPSLPPVPGTQVARSSMDSTGPTAPQSFRSGKSQAKEKWSKTLLFRFSSISSILRATHCS